MPVEAPYAEAGGPITSDYLFQQVAEAQEAEEPMAEPVGTIVVKPTASEPMGSEISEISGPGWVKLWNTRTGEEVKVNRWLLKDAIQKKHDDPVYPAFMGKLLFSTKFVANKVRGKYTCYLYGGVDKCVACGKSHKPHSDYVLYQAWGMRPCIAAHLPSPFDVRSHMEKRHKREWAAIKEHQQEEQRKADQDRQDRMLEILVSRANLTSADAKKIINKKKLSSRADVSAERNE